MADEDFDEASPWTRDDWVPDSGVPDADVFDGGAHRSDGRARSDVFGGAVEEPPPEDFDNDGASGVSSGSTLGRKMVAAAIVLALLIGSAGALLRNDGASEDPTPTTIPTTIPTTTSVDDRPPVTLEAIRPATQPTTTTLLAAVAPSSASADVVVEAATEIPPVVVGAPPGWAERILAVPERLVDMASTEVITLTQSGVVNVTEFPSGRTRSLDTSGIGAQLQLAVGDGTIVVFDSTTLLQIRDGEPVVESTLADGVIFVQPWTGTDSFIVTTPATGPETTQQEWVLRADGRLELLDDRIADESMFWSRVFSPAGESLITGPGGVYAIEPSGSTRRISTGDLLATGERHWAIEECDETLRCAYSVIEWETGTVTPGVLDEIATFGFVDPATHISPDGRSITYRSDTDGTGRRRILDVASGVTVEAGRISQFVYPDSWATDSSGLFIADRLLQFVDRSTGAITAIEGLDPIRTVATGRFSS